ATNHDIWPSISDIVQGMDDLYRTMQTVQHLVMSEGSSPRTAAAFEQTVSDMGRSFGEMNAHMDSETFSDAADCIRYELLLLFGQLGTILGQDSRTRRELRDSNMRFIRERFPRVFEQLNDMERERHYVLFPARNGSPNIIVLKDEREVFFYSRYSPEEE